MAKQAKSTRSTAGGRPVYLVDGARTPFIRARNRPGPFTPVDLAVEAGRPLLARLPFEAHEFDEVILGCVNVHADEVNPGRIAGLRLGLGTAVPGWTVQRNCASGQQSMESGMRAIADGRAELILAGGTEALSHAPLLFSTEAAGWFGELYTAKSIGQRLAAFGGFRPGYLKPSLGIMRGLTDPVVKMNMGQTAEVLAHRFDISREAADTYASQSHKRLAAAHAEGRLPELHPMIAPDGIVYDHDDGVRADSSVEQLAKLKPAFERPFGKVTAGNSSQITDGACWSVLASEEAVRRHDLKPFARVVDCAWSALDPSIMGLGPVLASTALLQRNGLGRDDVGAWEFNEAFATQLLASLKAWEDKAFCRDVLGLKQPFGAVDPAICNVDGGAISLGHPVGTTGTRITVHLAHVMHRLDVRWGVATECIGGGMGGAVLLERV